MPFIRLIIAFVCLQASYSFASSITEQIYNYINHVDIPRLSSIYPDADIKIDLSNKAALGYLPECQDRAVNIQNQRPNATKRTTYAISCTSPEWKSYLPITQSISIDAIKATSPINRGQRVTYQNTGIGKVDISNLRGQVYTEKIPPYGLIASRNIRINTFITDNLTKQPNLIKKGNQILITARTGNLVVKMNGKALENGIKGQQIRVKNISSGRIIYAEVVTDGEVLVNY
ncbi:MAG: flagellar basal body P-ring formation chaperone FlgA [Marinomonas sp.]